MWVLHLSLLFSCSHPAYEEDYEEDSWLCKFHGIIGLEIIISLSVMQDPKCPGRMEETITLFVGVMA